MALSTGHRLALLLSAMASRHLFNKNSEISRHYSRNLVISAIKSDDAGCVTARLLFVSTSVVYGQE